MPEKPVVMPGTGALLRVGPFELWPAARRLRLHGNPVALTPRAFDLLAELALHHPHMASKNALLTAVWPGLVVEENNLQVQISLLRKILGHDAITTVPCHGYRLNLAVSEEPGASGDGVPAAGGTMFGRERDMAELGDMLHRQRLTSLLGAGGVGKSMLARHAAVAGGMRPAWADLAECSDAATVLEAVARATGLDGPGPETAAALAHRLAQGPGLLVLDNADRVARDVALLAGQLLARAPALRLLVTTQVRLHLPEEQVYRLAALAVPPAGCALTDALDYGALALLQARAQGHDHRFALTEGVLADAVALCGKLDGLPLALELAAARIPALGVTAVLRQLDDPLPLLAQANGTGPLRQRSLQGALEWSYRLLEPAARALWRDAATMPPRFSLNDLMELRKGCDVGATLDLLGTLVDRSLLIFDPDRTPGYTLPAIHRAFVLGKPPLLRSGVPAK